MSVKQWTQEVVATTRLFKGRSGSAAQANGTRRATHEGEVCAVEVGATMSHGVANEMNPPEAEDYL